MTSEQRKLIAKKLIASWLMYGRELTYETAAFMIDNLADLPADKVLHAIDLYSRDPKNNMQPTVGKIRAIVTPEVDDRVQAVEAAARVVGAVTKFGWAQGRAAREYIGELGWSAVEQSGGWSFICENLGVTLQVGTFQAQIRDICTAKLQRSKAGHFDAPALPQRDKVADLESAKDVLKTITAKAEEEK